MKLPAAEFVLPLAVGIAVFLTAGAIIVGMAPTASDRRPVEEPELIGLG